MYVVVSKELIKKVHKNPQKNMELTDSITNKPKINTSEFDIQS